MLALLASAFLFTQCVQDDVINPLTNDDVTGEYTINTDDGSWRFDKAHSSVRWASMYSGDQAMLTGRFNSFGAVVEFDQADLENSYFEGWVQVSTCNTGEPGRDRLAGCGPRYLGVKYDANDTLPDGTPDPAGIDGSTDTAFFKTTEIVKYGDAYKAFATLTFNGATSDVEFIFNYITEVDHSANKDGSRIVASFEGEFDFSALTDHGMTTTNIADEVNVSINAMFRKN